MDTHERLEKDLTAAVKARNASVVSVLRMLRAELKNAEISKTAELKEDEVIAVIGKEVKKLKDSIDSFEKGGRQDLVDQTKAELDIMSGYMPEEMGDDELRAIVKAKREALGPSTTLGTGELTQADFGRLMKEVMAEVKGKAQGNRVSTLVKEELNK
ncbi:MAG: GatB/YqeY domain-containing protein [Patescibacteria group bacterium]|nr:GatB/YqeY domain-containing protein [Patescibacteria group bacterium]